MSARAIKRERERAAAKAKADPVTGAVESKSDSASSEAPVAPPARKNVFAMLADGDDEPESSSSSDVPAPKAAAAVAAVTSKTAAASKAKKQRARRKRAAAAAVSGSSSESAPDGSHPHAAAATDAGDSAFSLAVQRDFLNGMSELKRIFGADAIKAAEKDRKAARGGAMPGGGSRRGFPKSLFVSPDEQWYPYAGEGLSMRYLGTVGSREEYVFVHSPEYARIEANFLRVSQSYDPESVLRLAERHPYHVNTLLLLTDILEHHNQLQDAAGVIDRAVYACEQGFCSSFTLGPNDRLPYDQPTNRAMFLALFRHVNNLSRRGCPRTALEVCKLMLTLDLEDDPLAATLLLDYTALRAREYAFLLTLRGLINPHQAQLPNWLYSVALALFKSKRLPEANAALERAFVLFPHTVALLLAKVDAYADPIPFFIEPPPFDFVLLLETLYAERCAALWKEPEVLVWLKAQAERVQAHMDSPSAGGMAALAGASEVDEITFSLSGVPPPSVCRHVAVSGFGNVLGLLPKPLLESISSFDPFPPGDRTLAAQHAAAVALENADAAAAVAAQPDWWGMFFGAALGGALP